MKTSTISNKKRLMIALFGILVIIFLLITRIGYLQIVKGEVFKKEALEQWTRGIPVKAKRGIIYDRNKKKLAVSISKDTVWARPGDIDKKNPDKVIKELATILKLDEKEIADKLKTDQTLIKLKQWVEDDESQAVRKAKLKGIEVVEDNKRYYPNKNFAAHIIGHTNIDQVGQYGVERILDESLAGVEGKWVKTTDAVGRQLPSDYEKRYEAKDGLNVVLTLDERIQSFAEELSLRTQVEHNAKNVSIVAMDVKTGEILAMANKPDYDPNNPRTPIDQEVSKRWDSMSQEEKQENWFEMWRNFPINDSYEPGSTFKIITSAAGIEEGIVNKESKFFCGGRITRVKGGGSCIKAHGNQNLEDAIRNSCNVAMADIGLDLGSKQFYKYLTDFGFGEKTNVSLTGETAGIIPNDPEKIKDITLTTLSYGYGVAVTPMQLITAVSSVANGGNLMKPQIVKELVNNDGKVIEKIEPEVIRKPISKATSKVMLEMLEGAVSPKDSKEEFVKGYRVGGKTGTARKLVDGKYEEIYVASFVGVAPIDDPKIAVLVVVDEPTSEDNSYYGGSVAKPVAGELIKETLEYLKIEPTEVLEGEEAEDVLVPDLRNQNIKNAGDIISDEGLDYEIDVYSVKGNEIIKDQYPSPGTKVKVGSVIELYLNKKNE